MSISYGVIYLPLPFQLPDSHVQNPTNEIARVSLVSVERTRPTSGVHMPNLPMPVLECALISQEGVFFVHFGTGCEESHILTSNMSLA